jgi:3-methyladenine DNA glycosylase AlkD
MLLDICAVTVACPERFAQTGTGWVLREVSVAERERVLAFVEQHLPLFSKEGLRYTLAKVPKDRQRELQRRADARRPRRGS